MLKILLQTNVHDWNLVHQKAVLYHMLYFEQINVLKKSCSKKCFFPWPQARKKYQFLILCTYICLKVSSESLIFNSKT